MRALLRHIGYMLLAGIFIKGGYDAFSSPGRRVETVNNVGIPQPDLAVRANGSAMMIGGALLGLGIDPRLAALVLTGSIVPTTMVGHAFWQAEGESRKMQ